MTTERKMFMLFVSLLLFGTVIVGTEALIERPVLSVEPQGVYDASLQAGSSFSVDIVITNANDLGGYEFSMTYDTSVLTAEGVTYVDDPDFFWGHFVWLQQIDDTAGFMRLVITLPIGTTQGVDGSGTVVTIDFTVDDTGETSLDLHDTMLSDCSGNLYLHDVYDGYFRNTPFSVEVDGEQYDVSMKSNSSIADFAFDETFDQESWKGEVSFNVTGLSGTTGFCNISIPTSLMTGEGGTWRVLLNGIALSPIDVYENDPAGHTTLYFTYSHSTSKIQINGSWVVPEFPTHVFVLLLLIATLTATVIGKRIWSSKR